MPDPALPLTGGCPCGAVRYRIDAFPLLLYACHCTNCQRQSGSSFALNMPARTSSFRIVSGAPTPWHRVSPTGAPTISWFRGGCGGRLYGERPSRPERVVVRAGTLDDTGWLTPLAHLYMGNAQPWERFDGVDCFVEAPDDFQPLARKWREAWTRISEPPGDTTRR